jgi:hypothetical protein
VKRLMPVFATRNAPPRGQLLIAFHFIFLPADAACRQPDFIFSFCRAADARGAASPPMLFCVCFAPPDAAAPRVSRYAATLPARRDVAFAFADFAGPEAPPASVSQPFFAA